MRNRFRFYLNSAQVPGRTVGGFALVRETVFPRLSHQCLPLGSSRVLGALPFYGPWWVVLDLFQKHQQWVETLKIVG